MPAKGLQNTLHTGPILILETREKESYLRL